MKRMKKIVIALMVLALAISLTACGGGSAAMTKTFTNGSAYFIDAIGWYVSNTYTLEINSDNTYVLTYQSHTFGTTDPGIKGIRTVKYYGKCSSGASADGDATHVDYKLEPATRIYFEQHEKSFGRSTLSGHMILDTANWTTEMTSLFDPEGNSKKGEDFLKEFAQSMTITVEDPTLQADDPSLGARCITMPELDLVTYAG